MNSGIREVIEKEPACMNTECPPWYPNLADGIFAELYGLAGIAPWAYDETEESENSSSAKMIGDRIYCLMGQAAYRSCSLSVYQGNADSS